MIASVLPETRAMNPTISNNQNSDRIQTTGNVVLFLAVSSLLAAILWTGAFLAVLSSDNGSAGQIAQFGRVLGPYLGLVALSVVSIELLTIGLLAISSAHWRFSILRDNRWVASMVCAMFSFCITIALMFLYIIIATSYA